MFHKKMPIVLLTMLSCVFPLAATTAHAAGTLSPEQVVAKFQKLPDYVMFCRDEHYGKQRGNSTKIGKKLEGYFSKELYRLFMWAECGEPDIPPRYDGLSAEFGYDIRYGFPPVEGREEPVIHVQPATFQGGDKAIVKVRYGLPDIDKLYATYTLIREDARWKIDDIAPKADFIEDGEHDNVNYQEVVHSDSIKTDMQNKYRSAEKFYQNEKSIRSEIEKVMTELLTLTHYDLSCKDEKWMPLGPEKFGAKLEPYFSKEFYKLLLWSQCSEPQVPIHYADLKNFMPWDIRFGLKYAPDTGASIFKAKGIKVLPAKLKWPDKATVEVQFGYDPLDSLYKRRDELVSRTGFMLIHEDGQWKIDDIENNSGNARYIANTDPDAFVVRSFSIKDDMQHNLRAAEYQRYKQERAKKGAAPTP